MTVSKTNHCRTTCRNARRAFLIIDMMLGIAVLALVFGSTALVLAGLGRQRIIAAQYFLANETVANIVEEITTSQSLSTDEAAAKTITLPSYVIQRIPGAELSIDISALPMDEPATKQITCAISWPSATGQPPHRCALTTWSFQHE